MTFTDILLIIIALTFLIDAVQVGRRIALDRKNHKAVMSKFTLYDTRFTAHKHSVNKSLKEMDEKVDGCTSLLTSYGNNTDQKIANMQDEIESLKKNLTGVIDFPKVRG